MRTFVIPAFERFNDGSQRTVELVIQIDQGGYIVGGGGVVYVTNEGYLTGVPEPEPQSKSKAK